MEGTRDRIVAATNEQFRRLGYNGTSLSKISEASGATVGSIYHFFPGGKEEIGVAVVTETGAVYRELFEAILSESGDLAEGMRTFFVAAGTTLAETDFIDPCPIGTVAREVANVSEPLRTAAATVFETWIGAARRVLRDGGVGAQDAERLATTFVALVEGSFVLARAQRDTTPLDHAGELAAGAVAAAVDREASSASSSSG